MEVGLCRKSFIRTLLVYAHRRAPLTRIGEPASIDSSDQSIEKAAELSSQLHTAAAKAVVNIGRRLGSTIACRLTWPVAHLSRLSHGTKEIVVKMLATLQAMALKNALPEADSEHERTEYEFSVSKLADTIGIDRNHLYKSEAATTKLNDVDAERWLADVSPASPIIQPCVSANCCRGTGKQRRMQSPPPSQPDCGLGRMLTSNENPNARHETERPARRGQRPEGGRHDR